MSLEDQGPKKYSSIDRLRPESPLFLFRRILGTEKVDGTNGRVGLYRGNFFVGGRNIVFGPDEDPFGFASWAKEEDIEARLRRVFGDETDVVCFGEWYGRGIQRGIDYGEGKNFAGFDVCLTDYLDFADMVEVYAKLGLPTVPVVFDGALSPEVLEDLAAQMTQVGIRKEGNLWEGVVLRPPVTLRDRRGERLIAKHKNPRFEEVSRPREPRVQADQGDVEAVLAYVTAERLKHVLTALREQGKDITRMETTREVIQGMVLDVIKEATDLTEAQRALIGKVVPAAAKRLYFKHLGIAA